MTMMVGYWGMGETVSSHGVNREFGTGGGGGGPKPGGDDEDPEKKLMESPHVGGQIESQLRDLLDRVEQLLIENRFSVLAVAHALETHKTITGEGVAAISARV